VIQIEVRHVGSPVLEPAWYIVAAAKRLQDTTPNTASRHVSLGSEETLPGSVHTRRGIREGGVQQPKKPNPRCD
jgi:hypothetical protein